MKKIFIAFITALLLILPVSAQIPDMEEAALQPGQEISGEFVFQPRVQIPELALDHETDLNLRVEAIRDRRRAYTSLTDLHGLDILIPASAQMQDAYRDLVAGRRQESVSGLFELEQEILSGEARVLLRVEELGLFSDTEDAVFLRTPTAVEEDQVNMILFGGVVVTLCVSGFFLSNHLHKRKRKGKKHVSDGNLAAAGE